MSTILFKLSDVLSTILPGKLTLALLHAILVMSIIHRIVRLLLLFWWGHLGGSYRFNIIHFLRFQTLMNSIHLNRVSLAFLMNNIIFSLCVKHFLRSLLNWILVVSSFRSVSLKFHINFGRWHGSVWLLRCWVLDRFILRKESVSGISILSRIHSRISLRRSKVMRSIWAIHIVNIIHFRLLNTHPVRWLTLICNILSLVSHLYII